MAHGELSSGIDLVFLNGELLGEQILELDIRAEQSGVISGSILGGDRAVVIIDVGAGAGPNGGGPFCFTSPGPTRAGDGFHVGKIETNKTGVPIVGSNSVVSLRVSSSSYVTLTPGKVQLRRRTGVGTWALIPGAIITIPVGEYEGVGVYDILLPDDPELGAVTTDDSGNMDEVLIVVQLKYEGPSTV